MKPNSRVLLIGLALTFLLASAALSSAQTANASNHSRLSGTWRVQVTIENCATHTPLGPPFASMLAFAGNGTLSGTTQNPAFAPGQRTSDYGVWRHTKNHTYWAASEAYVLTTAGMFVRGKQRIEQAISVHGDQFLSVATVKFYDASDNLLVSGCAVATGTRFE